MTGESLTIELPFPPASLSGHTGGPGAYSQWAKIAETKKRRALAKAETKKAGFDSSYRPPETGDIRIHIAFIPPDNRGDRVNYPARMKAYIDGVAEAMGVNDKRFLPSWEYLPNAKPGHVKITLL